jgi:hypothetical protein
MAEQHDKTLADAIKYCDSLREQKAGKAFAIAATGHSFSFKAGIDPLDPDGGAFLFLGFLNGI